MTPPPDASELLHVGQGADPLTLEDGTPASRAQESPDGPAGSSHLPAGISASGGTAAALGDDPAALAGTGAPESPEQPDQTIGAPLAEQMSGAVSPLPSTVQPLGEPSTPALALEPLEQPQAPISAGSAAIRGEPEAPLATVVQDESTAGSSPQALAPSTSTTGMHPALGDGTHPVRARLLARAREAREARGYQTGVPGERSPVAEGVDPPARALDYELDLIGSGVNPGARSSPHRPPNGPQLSPALTALVGTLLGLAVVTSIIALAIRLDPQPGLPESVPPSPSSGVQIHATTPDPIPRPPRRERQRVQGPWRIAAHAEEPGVRVISGKVGREPFLSAVQKKGLPSAQAYRLLKAMEGVRDLDRCHRDDQFLAMVDSQGKLKAFEYIVSKEEVYQAREDDSGLLRGQRLDLKVEHAQVKGSFTVGGAGLAAAAQPAGFEEGIVSALKTALYGHLSLSDIGPGDRLRIVAQEVTVLGEFARYAGIEALEYRSAKEPEKPRRIYYFRGAKERGYYDLERRSPYEGGWRNPIPGAALTSPYNLRRLHPVLKTIKPHLGTDFGAPAGTPIHASNYGKISFIGYRGAAGNVVLIEHPGGIETGYYHLSRFEPDLKVGDEVKRMQVIGYCGSTGRSTGPHLHFAAKRNGEFFDPMTLKLDALRVISPDERGAFDRVKAKYDQILDQIPLSAPAEPPREPLVMAHGVEEGVEDDADLAGSISTPETVPGAAGGETEPAEETVVPPPEPAQPPKNASAAVYLTDKELLEAQSANDDGEVAE